MSFSLEGPRLKPAWLDKHFKKGNIPDKTILK